MDVEKDHSREKEGHVQMPWGQPVRDSFTENVGAKGREFQDKYMWRPMPRS